MKVLVISPHPDDEVLGCGGTIARLSAEGHEVVVAIATRGWEPLFPAKQVDQVRGEAQEAARVMGAKDLRFLELPVTKLASMPEHELNGAFGALFDQVQPNWAFIPFRSDVHEDHRQIFDACMVATRPQSNRAQLQRVLCYETLSETHWHAPGVEAAFTPNCYIDLGSHLPKKLDAMRCYKSQLRPAPNARSLESIEALAKFRGMTVNVHAAEAFVLLRDVY